MSILKNTLSTFVGRKGLLIQKHSPEILLCIGVAGIVTATVMACRATLKSQEIIKDHKSLMKNIKICKERCKPDEYSVEDGHKDTAMAYVNTSIGLAKAYGPAIMVGIASIGCIVGSHNIINKRNVSLMAAYKTVDSAFNKYRERVISELGEEKDRAFRYGTIQTKAESINDGVDVIIDADNWNKSFASYSQYAKFYDESCSEWCKSPEYNLHFIHCQQNYANDLLRTRGHVFLNEVYDLLGIKRTKEGSVVGWLKELQDEDGNITDNYIDFGIFDGSKERVRSFVNGYENVILLDFNVDGVIWDMI